MLKRVWLVLGLMTCAPDLSNAQDGPSSDLRSYVYPRNDPKIGWQYTPSSIDFLEYKVCSSSDEPTVFFWEKAKYGAAHNCLLRSGSCAVKTDTMSVQKNGSIEGPKPVSGIFDSAFQLDGAFFGDSVPTRIWCAQTDDVQCDAASDWLSVRSVLDLIQKPGLCDFEEESFSTGTQHELEVSARVVNGRWLVEVSSTVDASLVLVFLNAQKGDLLVQNADYGDIPLDVFDLTDELANFGNKAPSGLDPSNLLGLRLPSNDLPVKASVYVVNKGAGAFRPAVLASSGERTFAILGLAAPLR